MNRRHMEQEDYFGFHSEYYTGLSWKTCNRGHDFPEAESTSASYRGI